MSHICQYARVTQVAGRGRVSCVLLTLHQQALRKEPLKLSARSKLLQRFAARHKRQHETLTHQAVVRSTSARVELDCFCIIRRLW